MSTLEAGLELIYTSFIPMFIRKYTVYKDFYPTVGGKDVFMKNWK
jgi:hypothetical protein